MAEERFAILPITYLAAGEEEAGEEEEDGNNKSRMPKSECRSPNRESLGGFPDEHDKYTNQGQISVAIGHLLHADLHQTADGNEHTQVPKPTYRQVRAAAEIFE